MDKRGQFYIVAAVMIFLVVSSLATVATYSIVKSRPKTVSDLSSELNDESSRIIDYGLYTKQNVTSIQYQFTQNDFTSYYLHKTNGANITFIYGNKSYLNAIQYSKVSSGQIALLHATYKTNVFSSNSIPITVDEAHGYINVTLLNKEYSFKKRDNEMFYFVITKEDQGEVFVESNQNK
jgi:hypothetical protein